MRPKLTLKHHLDSVRSLYFCKDQNVLASASEVLVFQKDGLIKLWDLSQPSLPFLTLRGHQGPIFALTGNQQLGTPNQKLDVLFSAGQLGNY